MKELIAIGTSRFLPGFALAGVKTQLASAEDVERHIRDAEGIAVVEGGLFETIPDEERYELQAGVSPVVIPLSEDNKGELQRLRGMIRSTLGVDLLK